ncbi:hypothetical protein [Streptomyces hoynatensis]|uniref:Terminase large subunit gp17-like C-terminal domain-containing protein n=1 Tax=Streptomyces hoynatensis TaxID=1141874 RepID=A0A3A9YGF3_9ACTN|nr:hypothetical protein [Streptomyces hoynatensis]RKN35933.1 hypothetical protein D7294_30350 [Streptomyces hoynatensis]
MAKLRVLADGKLAPRDRRVSKASAADAKKIILATVRSGYTIEEGCRQAGKGRSTYDYYRRTDPDFRDLIDRALQDKIDRAAGNRAELPEFPEFSERYLNTRLFWHHLQWVDLLEGREPRDLHPNQRFIRGDEDQILVNTPPEHAKSTTLTVNYVVWRICQDPNVRILLISKTQDMAKKFLLSIKERLAESEAYIDLQQAFGPPGGFAEGAASWTADRIYVAGRDSGEKDPTVQAVGIGGHIYGSRCDLAIMDDCVDHTNHQQFESQINWIQNQVGSRVADAGGRMLLIGTRMETVDLYSEILKPQYYAEGESPWTYLTQPAVLETAENPEDWVTLWPKTNRPPVTVAARKLVQQDEDGLWPMWDGKALAKKRRKMSPRNWSMVYQQEQVADDAVFKMAAVQGCIDRARYPGRLFAGQPQHRKYGMEGLAVVAGLDPAAAGYTAMVVIGLDRQTGTRWVLEVVNKRALPPHEMRAELYRLTERYGIQEWRVERNAYQMSIIQDRDIRQKLAARGCMIKPHHTDSKKWDADFGVASMATLFEGWESGRNLIRLPSQTQSESVRALVEQLCSWFPETKGLTDTVMALWFAEIRCRELVGTDFPDTHFSDSEFMTSRSSEDQVTIDIDFALQHDLVTSWNGRWN